MELEELHRSLNDIEEWMISAEDRWLKAKGLLLKHIDENEVNEWERNLREIQTRVELLKNNRSDQDTENLIAELKDVHEQCKILHEEYSHLSEKFSRTGASESDLEVEIDSAKKTDQELDRSEEHTSELQSRFEFVCSLLISYKHSTLMY